MHHQLLQQLFGVVVQLAFVTRLTSTLQHLFEFDRVFALHSVLQIALNAFQFTQPKLRLNHGRVHIQALFDGLRHSKLNAVELTFGDLIAQIANGFLELFEL